MRRQVYRHGILAGGSFIIDHLKMIDAWPQQGMVSNILGETSSNGSDPFNVLQDLSAMQVGFPLDALGLVGSDVNGDEVRNDCAAANIGTTLLILIDSAPTNYTDD